MTAFSSPPKAGLTRRARAVEPDGRPEYLRAAGASRAASKLGVEQIGLWQLHRIDPKVPRDEQFDAVKSLLDDGVIRHAGLSEVSVAEIEAAPRCSRWRRCRTATISSIARSEDVLDYCERHGIGFIPWFPLAAGDLAKPGSILDAIAKRTMRRRARSRSPGC